MKKPWLIQRGKFRKNAQKGGIDSIVQFDYMGSAEFEFGALGKSLGRIRKNIDEYQYYPLELFVEDVFVLCKKSEKKETFEYIEKMKKEGLHTREHTSFHEDDFNPDRCDFWWDIENDFMFWYENSKIKNGKIPDVFFGMPKSFGRDFTRELPKLIEPEFNGVVDNFNVYGRNYLVINPRMYPKGYVLTKESDTHVHISCETFFGYVYITSHAIPTDICASYEEFVSMFRLMEAEAIDKGLKSVTDEK